MILPKIYKYIIFPFSILVEHFATVELRLSPSYEITLELRIRILETFRITNGRIMKRNNAIVIHIARRDAH